jgi:hypothetical protein
MKDIATNISGFTSQIGPSGTGFETRPEAQAPWDRFPQRLPGCVEFPAQSGVMRRLALGRLEVDILDHGEVRQ